MILLVIVLIKMSKNYIENTKLLFCKTNKNVLTTIFVERREYLFCSASCLVSCVFFLFQKRIDHRSNNVTGEPILIHKKGSKVVGLDCNPVHPELLLSCGNDHFVSLSSI